ncbi:MAG: hypothetical protein RL328_1252 [Acidobacteriota bacterium]|jgi:ABC-type transport system involved in multi-copper enzyme maturation permease subunit
MMWLSQVAAVIRLEMRKTFLSKRGLWVYLVALAPVAIMFLHSMVSLYIGEERRALAAARPASISALQSVASGMSSEEVIERVGEPHERVNTPRRVVLRYTDGRDLYTFILANDHVVSIGKRTRDTVYYDTAIFATVFQFFFLRLAVFFGCVGVFTNLFRAELLDKSLHYYLLTPLRREVLVAGKYIAGLTATVVIFCTSTVLQIWALSLHFDAQEIAEFLDGGGWGQIAAYTGVAAAACLGYGSVFLAAGLLFRNPIVPAAVVVSWEGLNLFLPAALKKVSVIYYLQSLCPVVAQPDENMNPLLKLLINAAEPVSAPVAVLGLLVVTAALLLWSGRLARRLEINYSTD